MEHLLAFWPLVEGVGCTALRRVDLAEECRVCLGLSGLHINFVEYIADASPHTHTQFTRKQQVLEDSDDDFDL